MNRIEIIRQSTPLEREVWAFILNIEWGGGERNYIRLDRYSKESKPTTRHRWRAKVWWNKTDNRTSTMTEPPLPADVEAEARAKFPELIMTLPIRK